MEDLPESIKKHLSSEEKYSLNEMGKSESSVLVFSDTVLKVSTSNDEVDNGLEIMSWLKDKLPVPKIIAYETVDNKSYLLMSKCQGVMACDSSFMKDPHFLIKMLANGLKLLWSIDVSQCPIRSTVDMKLLEARKNVETNQVDISNIGEDTIGEGLDFHSPQEILDWLYDNKPIEEFVLSHGDFCLPNIFFSGTQITGYVDLDKAGVSDKWWDIAICYRSLVQNYVGKYSNGNYPDFDAMLLFKELGIEFDKDKVRYYILLDELL